MIFAFLLPISVCFVHLTLILLTWTIWRDPTNASKWRMGFNSAFKGQTRECCQQFCYMLKLRIRDRSLKRRRQIIHNLMIMWSGIIQSVQRFATGWTIRVSKPGRSEIFRTRPNRSWDPFSLLYNVYRVSFLQVKRLNRGFNEQPPSSAEFK